MSAAFQNNAFQNNAFQTEGGPTPVVARIGYGPGWPLILEDANRYRGWSRQVEDEQARKAVIARLIHRVHYGEGVPEHIAEEVKSVTRGKVRQERGRVRINWKAFASDMERLQIALDAYRSAEIDREEEEILLL